MGLKVLLAGSIGALGVFVLTTLRDWIRGWRLRKREREGLLRLVSIEIELHQTEYSSYQERRPRDYVDDPELRDSPGRLLRVSAWEQGRTRIAQLLPADRFSDLALYYADVQWFNDLLDEHTSPYTREEHLTSLAEWLDKDAAKVRKWLREEYIGDMMRFYPDTSVSENSD